MALITRSEKGERLTIAEMDNNLIYLEDLALSNPGPKGDTGEPGANGTNGATGAQGDKGGLQYNFNGAQTVPPSGAFVYGFDGNDEYDKIIINPTDNDGNSLASYFNSIVGNPVTAKIYITSNVNGVASIDIWNITSIQVYQTTYFAFYGTKIGPGSSLTYLSSGSINLVFAGSTGAAGTPAGLRYNVTNQPNLNLPAPGNMSFNWTYDEGNPDGVDGIYINNTDLTGTNVASQIAITAQSTTSPKGSLLIRSDDGTESRVFNVTSGGQNVGSGVTYYSGGLENQTSQFTTKACTIQLIRNGDQGIPGFTGSTLAAQSINQSTTSNTITGTSMVATISSSGRYMFSGSVIAPIGQTGIRIGISAPASTSFFQLTADGVAETGGYTQGRTATNGALMSIDWSQNGSTIFFRGFFDCSSIGQCTVGFASKTNGQSVTVGIGSFLCVQKIS